MIRITQLTLLLSFLFVYLITEFVSPLGIIAQSINQLFRLSILFVLPGLLISSVLNLQSSFFGEKIIYTIGLSISFLLFGGFLLNFLLPIFHIEDPLSSQYLYYFIIASLGILLLVNISSLSRNYLNFSINQLVSKTNFYLLFPIFLVLLGEVSALLLNNNANPLFTNLLYVCITLWITYLVTFYRKIPEGIFPLSLYGISLSLLLLTSLRSWYIYGHDILTEVYVYQLTQNANYWNIELFKEAYNACLSITILPTFIANFTLLSVDVIFNIIFQAIFALFPVISYYFFRRFQDVRVSFLSAFFLLSLPTFFMDLPFILRQEIAFFFFGLMLLVASNIGIGKVQKVILVLVFGCSLIASHYSTSYITLLIFIIYAAFNWFAKRYFKRWFANPRLNGVDIHLSLLSSPVIIVPLLLLTVYWNIGFTQTSQTFTTFITNSVYNLGNVFSGDVRSNQTSLVDQFNIFYRANPAQNLENFHMDTVSSFNYDLIGNKKTVDHYSLEFTNPFYITPVINEKVAFVINIFGELIKKLVKVLPFIAIAYFLFKREKKLPYLALLALSCLTVIFSSIALPFASIDYNVLRTYLQSLMIISFLIIVSAILLFDQIFKKASIAVVTFFVLFYFLFYSGFISQFTGGNQISMHFGNNNLYYDKYYTHISEILSAEWLKNNYNNTDFIYSDPITLFKIRSFTELSNQHMLGYIIPELIGDSSYVYLNYNHIVKGSIIQTYKGNTVTYKTPIDFLESNKDLIYDNGESRIYK